VMPPPCTPPWPLQKPSLQSPPFTPNKSIENCRNERYAGRATNQLAKLYFFDRRVMARSTLSTLDRDRLRRTKLIIIAKFGWEKSPADREVLWSRCRTALGQRCKNIRSELRCPEIWTFYHNFCCTWVINELLDPAVTLL
jgi:hypothetical protein